MKRKILFTVLLSLIIGLVLNAQTAIAVPKEEVEVKKEPIVLAVSKLQITGAENFNLPDANAIMQTLSSIFGSTLANYQIPGVEVASRISDEVIRKENETVYSYNLSSDIKADYLLQGQIIIYTSGTILFTAQIVSTETKFITSSIKSGYQKITDLEQLLTLVDDLTEQLVINFTRKLGIEKSL